MGATNLDVTPSFTYQNGMNRVDVNVILFGKRHLGDVPHRISFPYGKNLFFGQFGFRVIFAKVVSFLFHFVQVVIGVCTDKKVPWIDAGFVIAFMKNLKSLRDAIVVDYPGYPVGHMEHSTNDNLSVSLFVGRTDPSPAGTCFLNGFPESVFHACHVVVDDLIKRFNFHVRFLFSVNSLLGYA